MRAFLNQWRYAFREFSVPGDRNNVGGILGIDPTSFDKEGKAGKGAGGSADGEAEASGEASGDGEADGSGNGNGSSKVRILREEDIPKGPRRRL